MSEAAGVTFPSVWLSGDNATQFLELEWGTQQDVKRDTDVGGRTAATRVETAATDMAAKSGSTGRSRVKEELTLERQLAIVKHFSDEQNRPMCSICGKTFSRRDYLTCHLVTHTGVRAHKCGVCGKTFSRSSILKTHLVTHTGERAYKCGVCGKLFSQNSTLKNHVVTHTGEKAHVCGVCGRGFSQHSTLKNHLVTHTGERAYKCTLCEKTFSLAGNLRRHLQRHTNAAAAAAKGPYPDTGRAGVDGEGEVDGGVRRELGGGGVNDRQGEGEKGTGQCEGDDDSEDSDDVSEEEEEDEEEEEEEEEGEDAVRG